MKSTRVQNFMLFTLGKWFEEANKKIKDQNLAVSINKVTFIDLVKKAEIAEKQERALYKNLEMLEEKKLISYKNKELKLTERGRKLYEDIDKRIQPFFNVYNKLKEKSPISYTRKLQTVFK